MTHYSKIMAASFAVSLVCSACATTPTRSVERPAMPEDSPSSYADAKERQQQPGAYYPGYGYYYQSQGANAGPATYQYPAGQYPAVQYPTGTSTTVQDQLHLYSGGN